MAATRLTWKDKLVLASRGTQFGAIINCALGRVTEAPRFYGKASVTSDGYVMCGFVDRNGQNRGSSFVGSHDDLMRNFNGISAHLKLTERQKASFKAVLQTWIGNDYRLGA